jgi:hypothetical protein
MVKYKPPARIIHPATPHSTLTLYPPPLTDKPKNTDLLIPPRKRTREAPPTTLQIAHTLLVVNGTLLETCPKEIVEEDELVTQLSKLVLPAEPITEVYELCGPDSTVEYYCGTDGKTRCFITDPNTIKIVEISDKDTEKQYPGLIMPRAENTLALGAGLGGAAYLSVLLINKASIIPKMTMLVVGFLQSAMSTFDFADGLVGATTEVLTEMVIEGSKNAATGTGLALLSGAQLISSMANQATVLGQGILEAGSRFEIPSFFQIPSVNPKILPVVIATVEVTKDTITGIYTAASFKNAVIATVVLSSMENKFFGTDIIRNTVQDTAHEVVNEFIDITGVRRVPDKIADIAKDLNNRTAETIETIRNQITTMSTITTSGIGVAVIVLAGVVMISADS